MKKKLFLLLLLPLATLAMEEEHEARVQHRKKIRANMNEGNSVVQ